MRARTDAANSTPQSEEPWFGALAPIPFPEFENNMTFESFETGKILRIQIF